MYVIVQSFRSKLFQNVSIIQFCRSYLILRETYVFILAVYKEDAEEEQT